MEIERQMQEMFGRLSKKDKRLHAGVEALKFQAKATFDFLRNDQGFNSPFAQFYPGVMKLWQNIILPPWKHQYT